MITIEKIDEVYLKIRCEPSYARELSQFFTFKVPNHQYSPAFKKKKWDGTIKLFNLASQTIFVGLLDYVIKFCEDRSYKYEVLNVSNISFDESYIKTWLSEQKIYFSWRKLI